MAKATTTGKASTTKPATKPSTSTAKPSTKPATDKAKDKEKTTDKVETKEKEKTTEKSSKAPKHFVPKVYTKEEVIARVASSMKCSVADATEFVNATLEGIADTYESLNAGYKENGKFASDKLQLTGLCTFHYKLCKAREGRDHFKNRVMQLPERTVPKIDAGKALKDTANDKFNKGKETVFKDMDDKKPASDKKPATGKKPTTGKSKK